jgi:hypothetical protein
MKNVVLKGGGDGWVPVLAIPGGDLGDRDPTFSGTD